MRVAMRGTASRFPGSLYAFGAVLIWGFTFVPSKLALVELGPFTLAVLRFAVALLVLVTIVRSRQSRPARPARDSYPSLVLMGVTGVALFFGFQNLALGRTSATDAGLISGSVPAFTAAASGLLLKERLGPVRLTGIALSIAGVATMVLSSASSGGSSLEGDLLMLGAVLAWVVYTLVLKRAGETVPEAQLLVYTMAVGLVCLLPVAGFEVIQTGVAPVSLTAWLSVLFLGVAGSAGAFFCWNAAVRNLDATEASTYINLVPPVTVVSAALFLGETLGVAQGAGGALVLLGVYLAGR